LGLNKEYLAEIGGCRRTEEEWFIKLDNEGSLIVSSKAIGKSRLRMEPFCTSLPAHLSVRILSIRRRPRKSDMITIARPCFDRIPSEARE
jgi:hypothetical protein